MVHRIRSASLGRRGRVVMVLLLALVVASLVFIAAVLISPARTLQAEGEAKGLPDASAQGMSALIQATSPYSVAEFPVLVIPGVEHSPVISGSWMVWQSGNGGALMARNLDAGEPFTVPLQYPGAGLDLDGDLLVTVEVIDQQKGITGIRLSDRTRFTIAEPKGGAEFTRGNPRVSGDYVVWVEGSEANWDIYGHNLETGQSFPVVTHPSRQEHPAISENIVVWADRRHITAQHDGSHYDVYGYDLAAKREFRITTETAAIGQPTISGNTVVWWRFANAAYQIISYDIATKQQRVLVDLGLNAPVGAVDIDGGLVVWSSKGAGDVDVFGYDLARGQAFVVSRAIGEQSVPRISGQRVVWQDARHSGVGRNEYDSDVYGARLEAGSAPVPPAIGDPGATDARIEIVWPHGGAPVTEADRANVVSWLFQPGTMNLAACQWNPNVQLWRAVNSEPAERVATGLKVARSGVVSRAIPDWQFNDVDVSAAREPQNRVYFFVTVEGAASRSNVWAHAADARTNFPQQDTPTGTAPVSDTVAAKIEIVWPHGGASVSEAQKANITAMLFAPGSLASVPPDANPTVRLLRAQNNGVLEEVAVGERRLAEAGGVSYPVWDFNDVDVSAARDPQNKLYFMVSVDGMQTLPNVWVHGVDARTYFPQMDVPTNPCP